MNEKIEVSTGGSASYYTTYIADPCNKDQLPFYAECVDIMEELRFNYSESNVFKAIWRRAAARTSNIVKKNTSALYDAEKILFFSLRLASYNRRTVGSPIDLTLRMLLKKYEYFHGTIYIARPESLLQAPYQVNINDIIKALEFTDEEATIVRILWLSSSARDERTKLGAYFSVSISTSLRELAHKLYETEVEKT